MAADNKHFDYTVEANADLSSYQYRAISIGGTLATEADLAIGTLQNKPSAAGQGAQVAAFGVMKGIAGGAVGSAAPVTVASGGFMVAASSGTGFCGKNKNKAVASGDTFEFFGNFISGATNYDLQ